MTVSSVTTFCFYVAVIYSVTDLTAVLNTSITTLPLTAMFQQSTRSTGGTFGLLFVYLLNNLVNIPSGYITSGRMLWTIARDDAVPFSPWVRGISRRWRNPFNAHVICGICEIGLAAIFVANATAFTAIIGSFVVLTTASYCAAILPYLLTGRRNVTPGSFWMPNVVFYPVASIACSYIIVFNVIYMFPYVHPVTVTTMNYTCVMTGGTTILLAFWYLWKRNHGYEGPKVALDGHDDALKGLVGLTAEEEERLRKGMHN